MKQPKQGRAFERRNGQEGFSWEGIATKVDPAGNPPNRPRDDVNVRHQGGTIISRPGFQGDGGVIPLMPIHEVDIGDMTGLERPPYAVVDTERWAPHWLAEHGSSAGVRLWMVAEPYLPNEFASIMFLDTDADQAFQTVALVRCQVPNHALPIEKFNNEFFFGDIGGLRKLYLIPSKEGAEQPPVETDQLADEVIVSYPPYQTAGLHAHDGKLFFSIAVPGGGQVYAWDGLGITPETVFLTAGDDVTMCTYKDTLVASVAGDGLYVRDATGAWTHQVLGGFVPCRFPCSVAEYGNLLYILDGVNNIFTWDGATITLAHTIVGANYMNACAKLAGRLYFIYVGAGGLTQLGFVDQDNAVPFTDIGTRTPLRTDGFPIFALAAYRGRLWFPFSGNPNPTGMMWHSQQFVPFDGWQETGSDIAFCFRAPQHFPISTLRTL